MQTGNIPGFHDSLYAFDRSVFIKFFAQKKNYINSSSLKTSGI